MTDYEAQARALLKKHGIGFKAILAGHACPPWSGPGKKPCDHVHGDRYTVILTKQGGARILDFKFWNSKADKEAGKAPTAYSVLAAISGDYYMPETFENFCSEYGYDTDSRFAEATFKKCHEFSLRLRAFLTKEEARALQEIQ